jgi:hypothetical protein
MLKLIAVGVAGAALGAAATAGAVATRVVELRTGDVAPVAGTHVFCRVESRSLVRPRTGPALECGETKAGVPGSFGIGITDDAAYVGRWDRDVKRITTIVFVRMHHH